MPKLTSSSVLRFAIAVAAVVVVLLFLEALFATPPFLAIGSSLESTITSGIDLLLQQPSLLIFAWMALISIVFGYVIHFGLIWLRARLPTGRGEDVGPPETDAARELLGHFLGVIGVVYAVLLAFVVVSAWQEEDHTEEVALQEEQATFATYSLIESYAGPTQDRAARNALLSRGDSGIPSYIDGMGTEWQAMRAGCNEQHTKIFDQNHQIVTNIRDAVLGLHPLAPRDKSIYSAAIQSSGELVASRYHRLHHYTDLSVNTIMWLTLLVGGLITLLVPYVGAQVPPHQLIRTVALSTMVGMMFALALIFDHPFTGFNAIPPTPWEQLQRFMAHEPHGGPQSSPAPESRGQLCSSDS